MKKVLFFIGYVLIHWNISAQMPGGGMPGNEKAPSIGHIYGKLADSTGKPVSDASVLLLQNHFDTATKKRKEILLKGISTKGNGEFDFDQLPVFGQLKLKISATGYKDYEQVVSFMPAMGKGAKPATPPTGQGLAPDFSAMSAMFDKDLGKIKLSGEIRKLQDVTVTTTTSALKLDIDKKIFSVDKNITSTGGTALDVMKNVPSVQVDIDGNVKLRNSAPQLYIDGRPTTLSLDQIPADAIDNVEVITNPSAKYDASGGNAGILNIVLKKNRKSGYNGNVMAGIDKWGR